MQLEVYKGATRIVDIDSKTLDIDKTFNCGQSFRWRKIADKTYIGIIYNIPMIIRYMQFEDGRYGIATTATIEQAENILIKYLQLDINYNEFIHLDELDEFARKSAQFGEGIRILAQEPWETLISFIISQRNNIPKIISSIDKLCIALGKELKLTAGNKTFTVYTFPTPENIYSAGINGLQGLGLGYRDKYIFEASKLVVSKQINLEKLMLPDVSGETAVYELQKLHGVGPKVANCVALFGLNKLDMFPIDIWIQRIIDNYYPKGIDIKSYGKFAGLIQQYMFYYIKNI